MVEVAENVERNIREAEIMVGNNNRGNGGGRKVVFRMVGGYGLGEGGGKRR